MQNFRNLGGGVKFFDETPKGTSLADVTCFEPLIVLIRSRVFSLGEPTKKGNSTKSRREVIFHLFQLKSAYQ